MKFNVFQLVVTGIFAVLLVGGIAVFAIFGGRGGSEQVGKVTIWGTIDTAVFTEVLEELIGVDDSLQGVTYVEKNAASYESELINAIASGRSPDLVILEDNNVVSFSDKVVPINYSTVSERKFRDAYVDVASVLLLPEGSLGLPIVIDPLVMYFNRDIFASAGIASHPKTWAEVQTIAPRITALDRTSNVTRSAIALGSYSNVRHAKSILSTLFFQAGEPIVGRRSDGALEVVFGNTSSGVENPAESAVRFYTNFSNPVQSVYSWNRALPDSFNMFVAGDLGIYFGLASEFGTIRARNPNLSFDVAVVPQTPTGKTATTYGRMQFVAISRGAVNPVGALYVAQVLSGEVGAAALTSVTGLPSARRDLLGETPADAVASVFTNSALIARTWHDPNPKGTEEVFKVMIDSVVSGRDNLGTAVRSAAGALSDFFAQ